MWIQALRDTLKTLRTADYRFTTPALRLGRTRNRLFGGHVNMCKTLVNNTQGLMRRNRRLFFFFFLKPHSFCPFRLQHCKFQSKSGAAAKTQHFSFNNSSSISTLWSPQVAPPHPPPPRQTHTSHVCATRVAPGSALRLPQSASCCGCKACVLAARHQ